LKEIIEQKNFFGTKTFIVEISRSLQNMFPKDRQRLVSFTPQKTFWESSKGLG
jgi:hypothetical protein